MTKLLTSGAGKQGYCKLCSFDDPKTQDEFDKRVTTYSPKQLNEWLGLRGIKAVDRATIYNHRDHVAHPKDRLVSAVVKRRQEHGYLPARVSEHEFLEAIISMGHERAIQDPEAVTIDQALKATQIKMQSKSKGDAHNIMIQILTGHMPAQDTVIEGVFTES